VKMKSRCGLIALAVFLATACCLLGQNSGQDQWIGTWKLNRTKSKYQAPAKVPLSRVVKFEAVPGGMKATSDLVDAEGNVHIEFTAKYDGKDVVLNGPELGLTVAVTRIDAFTFDTVQKYRGEAEVTSRNVVSRDGKTLTTTAVGMRPSGEKVTHVSVYDKQP